MWLKNPKLAALELAISVIDEFLSEAGAPENQEDESIMQELKAIRNQHEQDAEKLLAQLNKAISG